MSESKAAVPPGNALYGLGVLGALVYYWQHADGFWGHVLAIGEGVFWPALMVYDAFSRLR
jgi:hypothetical protein